MLPDISGGRLFCKWLRDTYGIDTDALPTYLHVFEDGRRVPAKALPRKSACGFSQAFSRRVVAEPRPRLFPAPGQ